MPFSSGIKVPDLITSVVIRRSQIEQRLARDAICHASLPHLLV